MTEGREKDEHRTLNIERPTSNEKQRKMKEGLGDYLATDPPQYHLPELPQLNALRCHCVNLTGRAGQASLDKNSHRFAKINQCNCFAKGIN